MTALDYPPEQRARDAARALWGCPRPDKVHRLTREHAAQALALYAGRPGHDPTAQVYRCPCGGWTWGRPTKRRTKHL